MTKPLVFIPSPRNLELFNSAIRDIKFDKLWVKYYEQELAYIIGRSWFLQHEEYTHLVILPDDLIVKQTDIEHLVHSSVKYDIVISGWCNVDAVHEDSEISEHLPPDPPAIGKHKEFLFLTYKEIEVLRDLNYDIIPVKFSGFAPAVIPRKVVDHIPFRASAGCCVDSCFSLDLEKIGIKQFADLRIRGFHLKTKDSPQWYSNILTGKEKPIQRFEPA